MESGQTVITLPEKKAKDMRIFLKCIYPDRDFILTGRLLLNIPIVLQSNTLHLRIEHSMTLSKINLKIGIRYIVLNVDKRYFWCLSVQDLL